MSEAKTAAPTLTQIHDQINRLVDPDNQEKRNGINVQLARLSYALAGMPNPQSGRYERPCIPGAEFNTTVCQGLTALREKGQLTLARTSKLIAELRQSYFRLVALPVTLLEMDEDLEVRKKNHQQIFAGKQPQLTQEISTKTNQAIKGALAEFTAYCFFDHADNLSPEHASVNDDLSGTDLFVTTEEGKTVPVQIKYRASETDLFPFVVKTPDKEDDPVFVHLDMNRILADSNLVSALFSPDPPPKRATTQINVFRNQFNNAINQSNHLLKQAA